MKQIAALSAANHGVFGQSQWCEQGLTLRQLRYCAQNGTVEKIGPRSFRFAGQPVTWHQRLAAGLVDLGASGIVGGDAAARLLNLDGFGRSESISFALPRDAKESQRSTGGEVRLLRRLHPIDRTTVDGFACLSASRLIVEESGRWSQAQLIAAIDSACRLGWTTPIYLKRRLQDVRVQGKAGVRAVDRILDDVRTESWLEREFLSIVRSGRLPRPDVQRVMNAQTLGRVIRVDFCWPDEWVIVEVNGYRFHSTRAQVQRDHQRHTELTLLGYRVLTFTYDDVTQRSGWVEASLRSALKMAA